MKTENILKLLKLLHASNVTVAEEWVKCSCLFARHTHKSGKDNSPSAGIHIDTFGFSGYSCFSCHKNFHSIESMLSELAMSNQEKGFPNTEVIKAIQFLDDEDIFTFDGDLDFDESPDKEFFPFPPSFLDSYSKANTVQQSIDYLIGREVPQQVCIDFDLRFDHARQAIGFPYYSATGKLAGMRGRIIDPLADKKYRHHDYSYNKQNNTALTWYRESKLNADFPLIVVEGEFDCARVYQWYRNTTALLTSGASPKKLKKLLSFSQVFWLTDNDKAGVDSRAQAKDFFENTSTGYTDIFLPEEIKDPSAMKASFLRFVLKEFVTLDEFISD